MNCHLLVPPAVSTSAWNSLHWCIHTVNPQMLDPPNWGWSYHHDMSWGTIGGNPALRLKPFMGVTRQLHLRMVGDTAQINSMELWAQNLGLSLNDTAGIHSLSCNCHRVRFKKGFWEAVRNGGVGMISSTLIRSMLSLSFYRKCMHTYQNMLDVDQTWRCLSDHMFLFFPEFFVGY